MTKRRSPARDRNRQSSESPVDRNRRADSTARPEAAAAEASDPAFERAALILWAGLATLVVLRAVLTFVPSMWGWSFNLQRFLSPLSGWTMWALAAFPLVPWLARWARGWLERAGERIANVPLIAYPSWALVTSVILWFTPERVQFVGDFFVRLGAADAAMRTEYLFPQAFPLDLFVHHGLPVQLARTFGFEILTLERLIGCLEAGGLAMLGVALARTLGLRRGAAFATAMVVLLGGYLGLFTGYGKALREMCLVFGAVGVFGLRAVRTGRGFLPLGVALSLGFLLHRAGAVLVLPAGVAWLLALRAMPRAARRRPTVLAGIALPLAVLAWMAPRIARVTGSTDAVHLDPNGSGLASVLARAISPIHLLDIANVAFQLSPIALVAPLLMLALWRHLPRREVGFFAAFATPLLLALLFVHPRQGVFRDWDVFAASGVGLSIVTAWLVGMTLRSAPRYAWLALAVMFGVEAPTAQFLMHSSRMDAGFARIHAYLEEPPARAAGETAYAYNFLGLRYSDLGRLDQAAAASRRAAEFAPSPRLLYEWATAEADRGNFGEARAILYRTLEKAEPMFDAWSALAYVSLRLDDVDESRRAAERALALRPDDPGMRELLETIARLEAEGSAQLPR